MSIKDKLQIYLVTYNREQKLIKTLEKIFSDDSPIKDFEITIIDNASDDNTEELLLKYSKEYSNITYLRNKINIGGNANIAKAIEMAAVKGKDYFWILCDDDDINWSEWNNVEKDIEKGYDAILVEAKCVFDNDNIPYILNTSTFLPAVIYKTNNITSQVLQNVYCNIYSGFPHIPIMISLINNNKTIHIASRNIIHQNMLNEFTRGCNDEIHFRQAISHLFPDFINSFQLIKDKKLRRKCCNVLWIEKSFYFSMKVFWKSDALYKYNICDIFNGLSYRQKLQFIIAGIQVLIENILKFIFSIKNSPDKSHKCLKILGVKANLRRKK